MTKEYEIIERLAKSSDMLFFDMNKTAVLSAMEEYGKYCAEQAWKAKGSFIYHGDFEDWWNEFKKD